MIWPIIVLFLLLVFTAYRLDSYERRQKTEIAILNDRVDMLLKSNLNLMAGETATYSIMLHNNLTTKQQYNDLYMDALDKFKEMQDMTKEVYNDIDEL